MSRVAAWPPVLILPGYADSGPGHWQSLWTQAHPGFVRVREDDWLAPSCDVWVAALDAAVHAMGRGCLLAAHSLGCLQVAHWVARGGGGVVGALLVGPPDPGCAAFPSSAVGFDPVPAQRFDFPSVLVASSDDVYGTPAFARRCASAWGCRLVELEDAGHVNADAGYGPWPEGLRLLASLAGA